MTLTREQAKLLDGALTREIQWQKERNENNKNASIEIQIKGEQRLNDLEQMLQEVIQIAYN